MANSNSSKKDPFDFLSDLAHISESQEQILRDVSVVGAHSHRSLSPSSAAVDSPIPMEVFHTPSQNSPLSSFCASDPTPTTECHDPCTLNHTVHVDAVTRDLSKGVVEDSKMEKTEEEVLEICRAFLRSKNEKEKDLSYLSLFEVAEACGMEFPQPRWWPEGKDFYW